ncbi:MAG: hypothetical protein L3J18_04375 [Candidatus Brocadia sp.]|jgi:hypothetical protein|uniref:Uncharacterized protein n=1 Tax=Candidatus Brocadia fulgida TaxID=380242 RepID=A0A0M2UZC5_9BACT|nr:MAG: hypothetical protein BROFUL_00101 [Candidatus Brocadia fulgida]UJS21548.1 MAG: hypothetical protein L3J18_04375 [Candidatus Brocadia sp.]
MATKRTVKVGDERFLEFIAADTGMRTHYIPLDETEYKHKTAEVLIEGHMRKNPGVTYGGALLKVSAEHPEFFI